MNVQEVLLHLQDHEDRCHCIVEAERIIRELEAELAKAREDLKLPKPKRDFRLYQIQVARAEKADRELNDANNRLNASQARVAELTRALSIHHQHEHPEGTCAYCRDAREREAD